MAGINVIDPAGTDRPLVGIKAVDPAGTDRTITQINVIDPAGTDRVVWTSGGSGSLAVSVTPASVSGTTRGTGSATSGSTTASASGGTGPYTYSWALTSYDNVTPPMIGAPLSATTDFTQTNIGYEEDYSATFTVTAKDSVAATATTTVNVTWLDISGGGGTGGRGVESSR